MALEVIYDAIRATAGQDIGITAIITDEYDMPVESGCGLMLHGKNDELITTIDGSYLGEGLWQFEIPASLTTGLSGRYFYCICEDDVSLCFQTPIYFK